jgi:hypothetical protein
VFLKKSPQNSQTRFMSKLLNNLYCAKISSKMCDSFCNFQKNCQSKQNRPMGEKFAQSGHPARNSQLPLGVAK